MKFPYAVKYNGVIYAPNTEIPEPTVETEQKVEPKPNKKPKIRKAANDE